LFVGMTDADIDRVAAALAEILGVTSRTARRKQR
jgi:hypothetical protein